MRPPAAVFVVRRGSRAPQLVWEGSGTPSWNDDPRRIYLWSERGDDTGQTLGFVELDPPTGATGDFHPLGLHPTQGEGGVLDYWLTPDRTWLFFAWSEHEGDIFLGDLVQDQ